MLYTSFLLHDYVAICECLCHSASKQGTKFLSSLPCAGIMVSFLDYFSEFFPPSGEHIRNPNTTDLLFLLTFRFYQSTARKSQQSINEDFTGKITL